jgi:hypothetical protein
MLHQGYCPVEDVNGNYNMYNQLSINSTINV